MSKIQDYNTRLENNNTNLNEILNAINTLPTLKLQDKSVTPTKEKQTIQADETYNGLGSVSVEAIPNSYVEPNGTLDITENGEHNVKDFEKVEVNVISGYILNVEENTLNFSKGASVNENEVIL